MTKIIYTFSNFFLLVLYCLSKSFSGKVLYTLYYKWKFYFFVVLSSLKSLSLTITENCGSGKQVLHRLWWTSCKNEGRPEEMYCVNHDVNLCGVVLLPTLYRIKAWMRMNTAFNCPYYFIRIIAKKLYILLIIKWAYYRCFF